MTSGRNDLVDEYLHRLDNASVFLPADRREELKQEIVEHIQAGLEEADARHTEAVRAVLERLGPPADIVAAEVSGLKSSGSTPVVEPVAPASDVLHGHGADRRARSRQADPAVSPTASSSFRKRTMLMIGAAATTLVIATLAFSVGSVDDGPGPAPSNEMPSVTPSGSDGPTGAGDEPTASFSDESSDEPTASFSDESSDEPIASSSDESSGTPREPTPSAS